MVNDRHVLIIKAEVQWCRGDGAMVHAGMMLTARATTEVLPHSDDLHSIAFSLSVSPTNTQFCAFGRSLQTWDVIYHMKNSYVCTVLFKLDRANLRHDTDSVLK